MLRHHHFFGVLDLKTQQLIEGGIVPFYKDVLPVEGWNRYKHLFIEKPKVLNMRMLEPGFVIWTSSLSFALVAFMFEWLMTLKDFLVVKCVLLAFYRINLETARATQAKIAIEANVLENRIKLQLLQTVIDELEDANFN